jgi:hypothetical protein
MANFSENTTRKDKRSEKRDKRSPDKSIIDKSRYTKQKLAEESSQNMPDHIMTLRSVLLDSKASKTTEKPHSHFMTFMSSKLNLRNFLPWRPASEFML